MSCGSCVHHVDVALKDVDGVSKVDVRLRNGVLGFGLVLCRGHAAARCHLC
jgi:copper chaperone CopZ